MILSKSHLKYISQKEYEPNAADLNMTNGSCPAGFTSVNTTTGHECLKMIEGRETRTSFLETRRYAAMLGATRRRYFLSPKRFDLGI